MFFHCPLYLFNLFAKVDHGDGSPFTENLRREHPSLAGLDGG